MRILTPGNQVFSLDFLPDSRGLLVGTFSQNQEVSFSLWNLTTDSVIPLSLNLPPPNIHSWHESALGLATAFAPTGERFYLAWGGVLYAFQTADAKPLPVPKELRAHRVVLSPKGDRMLLAESTRSHRELRAVEVEDRKLRLVWQKELTQRFMHVTGFLADGDRFVTIDDRVRIHSFSSKEELESVRYPSYHAYHPRMSADRCHVGVNGYHSLYIYDLDPLAKPRRISGSSSSGDFVNLAFHPGGRILAIIHGGPTLIKVYDLATLQKTHVFKWKLGALTCVTFSPDGMQGAAGSRDGRIVVWDIDE